MHTPGVLECAEPTEPLGPPLILSLFCSKAPYTSSSQWKTHGDEGRGAATFQKALVSLTVLSQPLPGGLDPSWGSDLDLRVPERRQSEED